MLKKITKWLLKPYPFPITIRQKALISLGFGKFVFLFLIIFRPFNFDDLQEKKLYYALIYGIITMSIMLMNLIVLPLIFKTFFNPNKWTIYKMLLFVLETIIFIGIVNTLFSHQSNKIFIEKEYYFMFFITNTFSVGVFPLLFYVYITERLSNNKRKSVANNISKIQKINSKIIDTNDEEITIKGENKLEELKLLLSNLLYISCEKNYASIFYLENGSTKETLLRTSLNKIESQLSNYQSIIRCHKSYIINTNKVVEIKGNARSYLLKIPKLDFLIPVSRSFPKEMLFTLVN